MRELNKKKLSKEFSNFAFQTGKLLFIKADKQLFFEDASGKRQPLERVYFLDSEANLEDGSKKMPKPYVVTENGYESIGDILLYSIIDNNINKIVVLGSLRNPLVDMHDSSLNYDPKNIEDTVIRNRTRNNENRYYTVRDNGKGDILIYLEGKKGDKVSGTGNITVKVQGADEKAGNVRVDFSGKLALNQTAKDGDKEKITAQILLDNTKDAEKIQVCDLYNNTIILNKAGISVTDSNKNTIITTEKGIAVTDKNKNSIITDDKGIAATDLSNNTIVTTSAGITVKTEKKLTINVSGDSNITVNGKTILKSPDVTITGGKLTVNGSVAPTGSGPFNAIPNCLFTGAPHSGNCVEGT